MGTGTTDIWGHVMYTRFQYLLNYMDSWSSSLCFVNSSMVLMPLKDQEDVVTYLEWQMWNSFKINKNFVKVNITNNLLKAAGEMYIYSFLCPKFMFDWTRFYVELMEKATPDTIVQTLNRIMIMAKENNEKPTENIARKLLLKMEEKLSLQYKSIEIFAKNLTVDIDSVKWTKGMKVHRKFDSCEAHL